MRPGIFALAAVAGTLVAGAVMAAAFPATPAGQALQAWLDAFNSGDRARIEAFDQSRFPALPLDRALGLRSRTGGYELLGIEKSTASQVIFHVRARSGPNEDIGILVVNAADPAVIATLRFFPMPPGSRYEDVTLNASRRTRLITAIGKALEKSYVSAAVGTAMASALELNDRKHAYQSFVDGMTFATRLTADLRDISHDRHLEVRFSPVTQPPAPPESDAAPDPMFRRQMLSTNCGFEKADHLAPNIGYIKLNMFADPKLCAATVTAAMNFVAGSDALILDLRENGGGGADMVQLLAGYFFGGRTHIIDAYDREENTTTEQWTPASVDGRKFLDRPLFILTSRGTFSAAEAFASALQTLKRATLVGETTGGGGHMVRTDSLDAHFTLVLPFAATVNPSTQVGWEGTGVTPDVKVPSADALTEALKRAAPASPAGG